ncbi:MAG TPA: hypothetical protein VLJ39_07205 [Tepidisphaeraceae bacterium]|nr:hypothetical protein [Tepidisphaeraceae bacterium]
MSVMVDHEPLAADQLGLETVGQVLAHVQRENRLVTSLLIDGHEPDLDRIGSVRQALLTGHTVFIETVEPSLMAADVLGEVEEQLRDTDRLRVDAAELLQRGQINRAMEQLSGCFSSWHVAQESVLKVAQLLRIDLETLNVCGRPLTDLLQEFTDQLRRIRTALEHRDFVTLSDILTYEAHEANNQWRDALEALRETITPQ